MTPEGAVTSAADTIDAETPVDVCIANPWFYPTVVGPGERFRRYAPGLRDRGVALRVLTVQEPGLDPSDQVDGVPIERVPPRAGGKWRHRAFFYQILPRLKATSGRPDVLQLFSYSRWNVPFVMRARRLGVPTLLVFTLLGETGGSRIRNAARRLYRRFLFEPFDCVVTSSGVMTDELRSLGVSRPTIETIPNGVDLDRFRPPTSDAERAELRQKLGLGDPTEPVVLFVGGIIPRKGVDVLLKGWHAVAEAHPRARLVLVGPKHETPGNAEFLARIDEIVGALPDSSRVRFTGAVRNVEEFLRAADLFVFPSHREGMPNVVPEAMATGIASIVTPFQGLPTEFGTPGRDFELVEREPEALADAIRRALDEPGYRTGLGAAGRRWVTDHLSLDQSLDAYAGLYRRLGRIGAAR